MTRLGRSQKANQGKKAGLVTQNRIQLTLNVMARKTKDG
jgi:hypothetical protein